MWRKGSVRARRGRKGTRMFPMFVVERDQFWKIGNIRGDSAGGDRRDAREAKSVADHDKEPREAKAGEILFWKDFSRVKTSCFAECPLWVESGHRIIAPSCRSFSTLERPARRQNVAVSPPERYHFLSALGTKGRLRCGAPRLRVLCPKPPLLGGIPLHRRRPSGSNASLPRRPMPAEAPNFLRQFVPQLESLALS